MGSVAGVQEQAEAQPMTAPERKEHTPDGWCIISSVKVLFKDSW